MDIHMYTYIALKGNMNMIEYSRWFLPNLTLEHWGFESILHGQLQPKISPGQTGKRFHLKAIREWCFEVNTSWSRAPTKRSECPCRPGRGCQISGYSPWRGGWSSNDPPPLSLYITYIYIYTYMYKYVCVYTYTCISLHIYIYIYIYMIDLQYTDTVYR